MNLIIIGINHKTAPIDVREKFFLNSTEQNLLLSELKCNPSVIETFALSTCNRTEIYANVLHTQNHFADFIQKICDIKKMPFSHEISKLFYVYTDREAVKHLFEVATGLDSLILGEKQILGQVKEAVLQAQAKAMFLKSFNLLSNTAIRAGKKAQTETDISYGGSSISWAAVMLAEKLLGTIENKSILIIGAGEMSKLAVGQIFKKKAGELYLMNRTQSIAEKLAKKYNGTPVSFCDIKETLTQVDVCICSVSAPHYILEKDTVEKVMSLRQQQKLIFIDISMPRNIHPDVASVKNTSLFHLDDLEEVVNQNMRKRKKSVTCVEKIIDVKIEEFYRKISKFDDPVEMHPVPSFKS